MTKDFSDPTNEQLTKAIAEKVFGWKSVRKYLGAMIGRKQDRAGHWRKAKVPNYAGDQRFAYAIDDRIKTLKMWDRYIKELTKITASKNLPPEWASPQQRCQAALKVIRARHLRVVRSRSAASDNRKT
jgi:hypothetical protein